MASLGPKGAGMAREVSTNRFSHRDFKALAQRLEEETALLADWFRDDVFSHGRTSAGFELEAWLADRDGLPAPCNEAFLAALDDPLVVPELACFNIEINCTPRPLRDHALSALCDELEATWRRCQERARALDLELFMIGHLPTVRPEDLVLENMSRSSRFRALNEQVLRLRHGQPLMLHIQGREHLRTVHGDVMPEAAATSFQIHLQIDRDEAVQAYNAALVLAAPLLAASTNSPFLFGKALWEETRIPLFEQAIAMEGGVQRVTFGSAYVRESLFECFAENLEDYPILLPACEASPRETLHHLRLHNGTIWRWVRPLIGFDGPGRPHLRIEQRVVPSGPTIVDGLANAALFYGLVEALGHEPRPVAERLPFEQARANLYAVARHGLTARVAWFDGEVVPVRQLLLEGLLPLARAGLDRLAIVAEDRERFLSIIEERVASGRTGSWWQRAYRERHSADMARLAQAYLVHQQTGLPVHTWSL